MKNIAILIQRSTGAAGFHDDIFGAITSCVIKESGANFFVLNGGNIDDKTQFYTAAYNRIYTLIDERFIDGLIVAYTIGNAIHKTDFTAFCKNFENLPVITFHGALPGIPSVCIDNKPGMKALLSHLIDSLGYKKFAFITGVLGNPDAEERFGIFNETLSEKKLIEKPYRIDADHPMIFRGDFRETIGPEAAAYFLPLIKKGEIEVIVASNDAMAQGTIVELKKMGICVPDDVAVTGFDNARGSLAVAPAITTVEQSFDELMEKCVQWMIARLHEEPPDAGADGRADTVYVTSSLVIRNSCGSYPPDFLRNSPEEKTKSVRGLFSRRYDGTIPATLEKSLLQTLGNPEDTGFYREVRKLLYREINEDGDIMWWHQEMVALGFILKAQYRYSENRIERVLRNTMNLVDGILNEDSRDRETGKEGKKNFLLDNFNNLSACFKIESLEYIFHANFRELGITSAYIYTYSGDDSGGQTNKLLLAYNNGKIIRSDDDGAGQEAVLNTGVLPADRPWRYSIHPLHFEGESLGFVLLELNETENSGELFDRLQKVFSTALKGYMLIEREIQALSIIDTIQKKLLPEIRHTRYGDFDVSAVTRPLTHGGGDLFSIYYDGNRLKIAIGDVEGHGILAGIIMMLAMYNYQMLAKENGGQDSKAFLEKLNSRLYEIIANSLGMFSYVTFVTFHQADDNSFVYAGYHNPPIIYRYSEKICENLEIDGFLLGILDKHEYKGKVKNRRFAMKKGDILVLYTDGVTEVVDAAGRLFGEAEIKSVVMAHMANREANRTNLKQLRDSILTRAEEWGMPKDDMTLLLMQYNPR
ncbi:MAG: SpoIIE family protein phosphatase [Spirochaetales bacterium]|nr:SpoIIE family protein phosphatase [Spirochaetales bacterium]